MFLMFCCKYVDDTNLLRNTFLASARGMKEAGSDGRFWCYDTLAVDFMC